VQTAYTNAWTQIANSTRTAATSVTTAVKTAGTQVQTETVQSWAAIGQVVNQGMAQTQSGISKISAVIRQVLNQAWNGTNGNTSSMWQQMQQTVNATCTAMRTTVSTAAGVIKNTIANAWTAVNSNTTTAWNNIKTTITTALTAIRTAVDTAMNVIKNTMCEITGLSYTSVQGCLPHSKLIYSLDTMSAECERIRHFRARKKAVSDLHDHLFLPDASFYLLASYSCGEPLPNSSSISFKIFLSEYSWIFPFSTCFSIHGIGSGENPCVCNSLIIFSWQKKS
jgi:hypothetical protein